MSNTNANHSYLHCSAPRVISGWRPRSCHSVPGRAPDEEPMNRTEPSRHRTARGCRLWPAAALAAVLCASPAMGLETPIGKPQKHAGMEIAAVYLQPVAMEPDGDDADGRRIGHPPRSRHPRRRRQCQRLRRRRLGALSRRRLRDHQGRRHQKITGDADADGRERRAALRRQREARRTRQVQAQAARSRRPARSTHAHFGRHTDKETGVGPWFKPFTVEYEFTYAGIGKKGGY